MLKIVHINPVIRLSTSTGRIMKEICELSAEKGHKSWIAFSRGRDGCPFKNAASYPSLLGCLPVGSRVSVALHGILTRLTDRHGLGSKLATRRFVKELEKISPDVVHIHNVHGYFLNYQILFDYLRRSGVPVVWTVHDCWLYTGHCFHYASVGCDRWKDGCGNCPQRTSFPTSWFIDRSRRNYQDKRAAFTSLAPGQFTVVTVSEWMREEMSLSFLKDCNFRVIHNGIDTDVFCPCDPQPAKLKYGIVKPHILLGVASIWCTEKGFDDFIRMNAMLNDDEQIVLVGLTKAQKVALPEGMVGICRTADVRELAALYCGADVLLNLTYQDNYPTVNLEAISCGTPVVTYRTGGSPESITAATGTVVPQGDIAAALGAAREMRKVPAGQWRSSCREYALAHFRKEDRYSDYLTLYEDIAGR